jgi:hypothetical protein
VPGATKSCHNSDCARTIPDSAVFCPYCGDETSGLAVTHTLDRRCVHSGVPGGNYCTRCGEAVDVGVLDRGRLFKRLGTALITIAAAMLLVGIYIFAAKRTDLPLSTEIRKWAYNPTDLDAPDFRSRRDRMRRRSIGRPQDLGDAVGGYLAYGSVFVAAFGAFSLRKAQKILRPAEPPFADLK